jgi:hypothetical protein
MAKKPQKKPAEKPPPTEMEYKGPGPNSDVVTVCRRYLLTRIRKLRNDQEKDREDLDQLIQQRDNLHYDEAALEAFETRPGYTASREYRWSQHQLLREAYANWEYFLHYQNNDQRWTRMNILQPEERRTPPSAESHDCNWLFPHSDDNPYLRHMLDHYDQLVIGGEEYRAGMRNALGEIVERAEGETALEMIRHQDLPLWRPAWRRRPVGLGCNLVNGLRVDEPTNIVMDLLGIEARRAEIEKSILTPVEGGQFWTIILIRRGARPREHCIGPREVRTMSDPPPLTSDATPITYPKSTSEECRRMLDFLLQLRNHHSTG